MLLVPGLLVAGLFAGGCGDDDDDDDAADAEVTTTTAAAASSTTAGTGDATTTTAAATTEAGAACPAQTGDPSAFDPAKGTYAANITAVDVPGREISYDVVQFLGGKEAEDAYHKDNPDDPEGPPNDYYIVNSNPLVRKAEAAPDAKVRLVLIEEDGDADVDPATLDQLPANIEGRPFWLTFAAGAITDVCEQYVP